MSSIAHLLSLYPSLTISLTVRNGTVWHGTVSVLLLSMPIRLSVFLFLRVSVSVSLSLFSFSSLDLYISTGAVSRHFDLSRWVVIREKGRCLSGHDGPPWMLHYSLPTWDRTEQRSRLHGMTEFSGVASGSRKETRDLRVSVRVFHVAGAVVRVVTPQLLMRRCGIAFFSQIKKCSRHWRVRV